jgi:hypothetical protein
VKITGDTAVGQTSLPDPVSSTHDEDLLKAALEDPVLDNFPLDSSDGVLAEDEFGEFLLDVVDWL